LALHAAGLVRTYEAGQPVLLGTSLWTLPLPLSHDGGETFGFRFEGGQSLFGPSWALGYAADLGCWADDLARALAGVDLLAVEFNHDEHLQRTSGRPWVLIERVLGDRGHLSNRQAGDLLRAVLREGRPDVLRHVVPLHLSRDCNRPDLARTAAHAALTAGDAAADIVVSSAFEPSPTLLLGPEANRSRRTTRRPPPPARGDACA
jgi:phosphoribosyl 1,2-cyclic phosphodiesterase